MGLSASLLPLAVGSSAYIASSIFLLRRPLLPWTRSKHIGPAPVTFIAHRGGAAEGYENTLGAFKNAVDRGAEMLELDVHLSQDGQVVVAHDQDLFRLTGETVSIRERRLEELPCLQSKVSIDFAPGKDYSDLNIGSEARRLSTLDKVLEEFPTTQINIDLKDQEEVLVRRVEEVIKAHGAENRCVWGNFSQWTTEKCHKANPSVGLLFSMPRFVKLYLLFYTGLLPFVPLKETHLEIPMPSIFYDNNYRTPGANVGLGKLPLWTLRLADYVMMSPALFNHLHQRGVYTYLWVLNSEEEFARAFSLGATGVMTDYPSRLQSFLAKKDK